MTGFRSGEYNWYYQYKNNLKGHIMKYIGQFGIILVISFVGEILNYFIPLPVPASIYGLVIMFLCLHFRIIKVDTVKDTADFLIEIMPLMFIPAAVELMTLWHVIKPNLIAYGVITVVSTFAVMIISGHVTQFALRLGRKAAVEPEVAQSVFSRAGSSGMESATGPSAEKDAASQHVFPENGSTAPEAAVTKKAGPCGEYPGSAAELILHGRGDGKASEAGGAGNTMIFSGSPATVAVSAVELPEHSVKEVVEGSVYITETVSACSIRKGEDNGTV